jgi:hypothetical protein
MVIDNTHRAWMLASLVLVATGAVVYVPYAAWSPQGPRGGSGLGLTYGIVGTAFIVVCLLLGVRKKVPTWRIGRAEVWMRMHLWLGLASLALILFHSGFRFGGVMSTILMIVFLVVVGSGIVGLLIQHYLPRWMMDELPRETVYEEIPHVLDQLRLEAGLLVWAACGSLTEDQLSLPQVLKSVKETLDQQRKAAEAAQATPDWQPAVTTFYRELELRALSLEEVRDVMDDLMKGALKELPASPPPESARLKEFYFEVLRPFLADDGVKSHPLADVRRRDVAFSRLRAVLPPLLHPMVDDLLDLCEERRQLWLQERFHVWLHGWLYVHVPLSMALLILTAMHAVMSLRY